MIAQAHSSFMTPDEYLAWEAEQSVKHEYIDGVPYAMAGGTLLHNAIAVNLTSALRGKLRGTGCKVYMADAKVRVSESGPISQTDY